MLPLDEIVAAIKAIDGDHLLTGALAHRLRSAAPNFAAKMATRRKIGARNFPTVTSIMAAQCSVFDNWIEFGGIRPKRGKPGHYRDRFKVEIQFWTWTQADIDWNISAWHGKAHLWSAKDIKARTKRKGMKLPKVLSEEFRQKVIEMADQMDGMRLGLPYTKDGLTLLYNDDGSFVVSKEAELEAHVIDIIAVSTPSGSFQFTDFKKTTSKGQPLSGNCVAHSRMTTSRALAEKWDAALFEHKPAPSRNEADAGRDAG